MKMRMNRLTKMRLKTSRLIPSVVSLDLENFIKFLFLDKIQYSPCQFNNGGLVAELGRA